MLLNLYSLCIKSYMLFWLEPIFGFEGGTMVLLSLVPVYCLPFIFSAYQFSKISEVAL